MVRSSLLVAGLLATFAHARTSVSILPIEGPRGPAVRKALFAVLHGQRTLDVWPIARPARRGAQPDLVVEGTVVRMSGRISVRILSGKTGDVLDGVQLQPRD